MQSQSVATESDVSGALPGFHLEVKRQERLRVVEWCEQAEADAAAGAVPLVVFRRSRERWRVVLPFDDFLGLVPPE
jgi:hypothetical protein